MLADRPLPTDLDERLETLAASWRHDPALAAVYLFGSRGRGTARPRSDVDLAVILAEDLDAEARWRRRLDLLAEASRGLGTDAVELVVLEDAPGLLGHRVLRDGRLLVDRDPRRRTAVAEAVLRRYLDDARLRAVLDEALADRLREGRFGH